MLNKIEETEKNININNINNTNDDHLISECIDYSKLDPIIKEIRLNIKKLIENVNDN